MNSQASWVNEITTRLKTKYVGYKFSFLFRWIFPFNGSKYFMFSCCSTAGSPQRETGPPNRYQIVLIEGMFGRKWKRCYSHLLFESISCRHTV